MRLRVLLTVVFAWSALKGLELFFRPGAMDKALLTSAGLAWVFWVAMPIIIVLNTITVVQLWQPFRYGLRCAQAAVVVELVEATVCAGVGFMHPDLLQRAYIASRVERGLPVHTELLSFMKSPASLLISLGLPLTLGAIWLILLSRHERERRLAEEAAESVGDDAEADTLD